MQIKKVEFKYDYPLTPLELSGVDSIAIHHMAHATADEWEVERWHKENGWNGFGYNYWIRFNGEIIEGRGLYVGVGVKDNNSHIISIGLQGSFTTLKPTNNQLESLEWLISDLKSQIPSIKYVDGHNKWYATECPGKMFPIDRFREPKITDWDIKREEFTKYVQRIIGCEIVDGLPGAKTIAKFERGSLCH